MRLYATALAVLCSTALAGTAFAQRDVVMQRHQATSKSGMRDSMEKAGSNKTKYLTAANQKAIAENKARNTFTLTVEGIENGKPIPPKFAYCAANASGGTQDSSNINPAIMWTPPPEGTKSLVLLVVDKDVPASFDKANVPNQIIESKEPRQDFYHWVLVNMPPMVMVSYLPRPPTIGMLFFGTAMPMSAMSPIPVSPMLM